MSETPDRWSNRHSSVKHFEPLFRFEHLANDHLRALSREFRLMAETTLAMCHDGPELTVALRKLLEAKDAAVRQLVLDQQARGGS